MDKGSGQTGLTLVNCLTKGRNNYRFDLDAGLLYDECRVPQ